MDDFAVKRIQREILDLINSEKKVSCGIKVELINNSYLNLRGEIKGPPDTPYEGGTFKLKIKIPDSYPFQPPIINFETQIWHPNISSDTGLICIDMLKDEWTASFTLRTILLSIQALLETPEPDDSIDMVVATQYKKNPEMFDLSARYWTSFYAGGPYESDSCVKKLIKLVERNWDPNYSLLALSTWDWDLEKAIKEKENKYK